MNKKYQWISYINWFMKKYRKALKELEAIVPYRITSIETNSSGNTLLTVHIVGTGKEIFVAPEQLVNDDRMIEGFSKKDIKIISFYAYTNLNRPKYKIVSSSYCEKIKKMFLSIKYNHSNRLVNKTAEEITSEQSMIINMNPIDAHRVGYIYGTENILKEKEEKNILMAEHRNQQERENNG